jgi:hypothetical protein
MDAAELLDRLAHGRCLGYREITRYPWFVEIP